MTDFKVSHCVLCIVFALLHLKGSFQVNFWNLLVELCLPCIWIKSASCHGKLKFFTFLQHDTVFCVLCSLSELSDENMMDAHNLSVCFGPTLMPMPADQDQVRNQNYVNELIRILIVYNEKIFPADSGIMYEKCMVEEEGQVSAFLVSCLNFSFISE